MAPPSVTYYKNLTVQETELTVPEKVKGKYFSYLSNKQFPLYIQTPTLNAFPVDENTIRFKVKKDGQFEKLCGDLDQQIIDHISERSVQFFRGSLFSRNKIESSYLRTIDEDGYITVTVPDNLLIKDQRDSSRGYDEIAPGTEAIAILHIEGVAFTKKTIRLSLSVAQLKIYVKEQLSTWCILHDSDSEVDEPDPEEAESLVKALESAREETIQSNTPVTLEEQPFVEEKKEHDDEKDLF